MMLIWGFTARFCAEISEGLVSFIQDDQNNDHPGFVKGVIAG